MNKTRRPLIAVVGMLLALLFLSGCEKRTSWSIGWDGIEKQERWVITIPNR
jgi:hypothetical protein